MFFSDVCGSVCRCVCVRADLSVPLLVFNAGGGGGMINCASLLRCTDIWSPGGGNVFCDLVAACGEGKLAAICCDDGRLSRWCDGGDVRIAWPSE